jgi:8-oxo-dGTP diphosphatase
MPNTAPEEASCGAVRVRVAVGVIVNDRGEVLVARRAAHLHQGGLWEFPGGKIDAHESVRAALCRELHEELGIDVLEAQPITLIRHDYADKAVELDVWLVAHFAGEPHGREGQPLRWRVAAHLHESDFPAANAPIIALLRAGVHLQEQ